VDAEPHFIGNGVDVWADCALNPTPIVAIKGQTTALQSAARGSTRALRCREPLHSHQDRETAHLQATGHRACGADREEAMIWLREIPKVHGIVEDLPCEGAE
jgi:hypothetical protein